MNFSPELSIVLSFVGFSWIFVKKIYPYITRTLDKHIESVENKIHEAELLKEEASLSLKGAYSNKLEVENALDEARLASTKKIERMQEEHRQHLAALQEKYEVQLKSQLKSELSRQKELLMERISDMVMERLSGKIGDVDRKMPTSIDVENLRRLVK
jgi:F0F1-type ATP synthase membrane subunit b/b'